jgi:rod shape determining protein RodA
MSSPRNKLIYLFPWPIFLVLLGLLGIGLLNLYSTSQPHFAAQLRWVLIGLVILLLCLTFHYREIRNIAPWFYGVSVLLLALVPIWGVAVGGQKNWLALGPLRLQPSEFAKLAVILMLARYYAGLPLGDSAQLRSVWRPGFIVGLPLALIFFEGDLGSAIFFILILVSFFFLTGLKKRFWVVGLLLMALGGVLGYQFFLKDYQKARISTFMHPEADARGKGYHLVQSKIAVGSGQLFGKGFGKGTIHQMHFLPEHHTDFVFPVFAEERGFLGSAVAILLFAGFFLLLAQAAGKVSDPFGSLLISGVSLWLFWQWVFNLGGVLGLLPLAGVTLPFWSYGGSSLVTNLLAMGLALNVYMRRYVF